MIDGHSDLVRLTRQTPDALSEPAAPPAGGPAAWLSAAYCAEHAAGAILRADAQTGPGGGEHLLACAAAWRELATAMATYPTMNRRDDDERGRR